MDLVGSIIVWVIGLPLAMIIGSLVGVGVFLLHWAYPGDLIVRSRIFAGTVIVALAVFLGVFLTLGMKWMLLVAVFLLPVIFGYVMGVRSEPK